MSDEIKTGIQTLHGLYATGLKRMADWNKYAPNIQKTEQYLAWMDDTISRAPIGLRVTTNEKLLDYINKAIQEAGVFQSIPDPNVAMLSVVSTSGSAISTEYYQYVNDIAYRLHDDPEVTAWAGITITSGDELILNKNRSEIVHQRLIQLNPDLGNLHDQAVDATHAAQAQTQSPVEAAAILDRVLERFKGELINRCRRGNKATYSRISDNLAADSPLTKTVVSDGQAVYDAINGELMRIRKSMQTATGERMVQLLRQIEDHIIVITDALDPNKVGISFA